MVLKVAQRASVPPFIVMDVMRAAFEREAKGDHIIHMEVGQPGAGAPQRVLDALGRTMAVDRMGYTDAFGLPALRQAICEHYKQAYDVEVPIEQIAVTTGSSGAFIMAFLAAFDAGDKVALASPGYPAYRNILSALGVEVVEILVGPETNFQPTVDLIKQCGVTLDGLIIASPSNPTGTMIDEKGLRQLYDYALKAGIRLVSDEIYHGISFGEPAETIRRFGDQAIIVNSFSKYFAMTGWRLGWMVMPPEMIRALECLAQNLFISPPTVSQHAGIHVFECRDELNALVDGYRRNRELLMADLPGAGFPKLSAADGAFYLYADISDRTNDSAQFCTDMLNHAGVAATPGIDFDPARGSRFVRFSFARDYEDIAEGIRRLKAWL